MSQMWDLAFFFFFFFAGGGECAWNAFTQCRPPLRMALFALCCKQQSCLWAFWWVFKGWFYHSCVQFLQAHIVMGPFACSCESIKLALVGLSHSSPMIKALDWLCFPVFVQVICRNFTEAHILYIGGYSKEAVNRYKNKTNFHVYIFN